MKVEVALVFFAGLWYTYIVAHSQNVDVVMSTTCQRADLFFKTLPVLKTLSALLGYTNIKVVEFLHTSLTPFELAMHDDAYADSIPCRTSMIMLVALAEYIALSVIYLINIWRVEKEKAKNTQ